MFFPFRQSEGLNLTVNPSRDCHMRFYYYFFPILPSHIWSIIFYFIYFFMNFESWTPSPTPFTFLTPIVRFVNHSSPPSNLRKCMDINGRAAQSTSSTLRHLHFLNPSPTQMAEKLKVTLASCFHGALPIALITLHFFFFCKTHVDSQSLLPCRFYLLGGRKKT